MNIYRGFFTKERTRSFFVGLFMLGLSLVFQFYASAYSTRSATSFVGDFFLDHLPTIDLNPIIVEGALIAIFVSFLLIIWKPKYLIFTIKSVAVFIALRSFFVSVTHLGIYPNQIVPDNGFWDQLYVALNLQAGYFFSAHTGLPILMGLIFWDERFWRYLYFATAILFGISVLFAHIHYSIDVFAAPFMTYSIFHLAMYLFPEDYKMIKSPSL